MAQSKKEQRVVIVGAGFAGYNAARELYRLTLVARNIAASFGKGKARPYKHQDMGFLVDLGGLAAAANPLHIPLSGPAANVLTRGYHLYSMSGNRMRVSTDWALNGVTSPELTSLSMISAKSVPLDVNHPRA